MIWQFKCGCKYPVEEIRANKHRNWIYRNYVCPIHNERIDHVIYDCIRCGKKGIHSKNAKPRRICDDCRVYRKSKTPKKINPNKNTGYGQGKMQPPRKSDCAYYLECLSVPGGRLFLDAAACVGCKRYRKQEYDVMQYVTGRDSITATAQI